MRLEYKLTEADYVYFNEYHIEHSPTIKRSKRYHYYFVPAAMLLLTLLYIPHGAVCLIYLLAGIGWLAVAPTRWKRLIRRRLERLLREGDNTTLFGSRSLSITPEGLAEARETGKSEVTWRGINKVAAGEHGVYLFVGGTSAYVVPNSAFDSVNTRERFIEEALRYREQAAGMIEVA